MIFVSVAEAARHLGIDAKTVHRWLADAQLPLQSHPHDGRKKGVSGEHLHALARLHQRSLAPFPQERSASLAEERPALSAALLALPERLDALQAQIATLQQQVAVLTHLLEQHRPAPSLPLAPTKPPSTVKRPAKPTRPAPRSRSAAKLPKPSAQVLPRVEYATSGRYVVICPKQGLLPLSPDTPEWFAWVAKQSSFRFVGKGGRLTAHHEGRVPKGAWRAHRHIRNRSYTLRLAPTQELTMAVLEQAAATLQAHLR